MYGYSPYAYSLNNPALYVDPDGNFPVIPWLIKAGAAAAADMLTQVAITYKVTTWGEAFGKVNWWQVTRSGFEGLIPWKTPGGAIGKAALTAVGDVLVNALSDPSGYTSEKAGQDFAIGFIGGLAGEGFGELIARYGAGPLAKGLITKLKFSSKVAHSLTGVWHSVKDNNFVGELATRLGNIVEDVDMSFSFWGGHGDIDIVTSKFNVEVKSGGRGSKMKLESQSKKTQHFTSQNLKKYVMYFPNATSAQVREAAKQGYTVITKEDELKKLLYGN